MTIDTQDENTIALNSAYEEIRNIVSDISTKKIVLSSLEPSLMVSQDPESQAMQASLTFFHVKGATLIETLQSLIASLRITAYGTSIIPEDDGIPRVSVLIKEPKEPVN